MRFLRCSPSLKVMFPRKGLTSPEEDGSKTQDTVTSPKRPLLLTSGNAAAEHAQRFFSLWMCAESNRVKTDVLVHNVALLKMILLC